MSGLTKKTVFADRALAVILGVKEGELVSYAQLSKGVHKYIKDNDLRNPNRAKRSEPSSPPSPATQPTRSATPQTILPAASGAKKTCMDCGAEIPAEAAFCDLCGVKQ